MRYDGSFINAARANGMNFTEGKLNGYILFSDKAIYKQNGLMALFMGDTNSNTSTNKAIWKNLGSGNNLSLSGFGYISGSGWTGESLYCDGVDDLSTVLTLPDSVYTMECVFRKPANLAMDTPISNWAYSSGVGFSFGGRSDGSASYGLTYGTTGRLAIGSVGDYQPNTIYSLSVSYSTADSKFYYYVNGSLVGSGVSYTGFVANNQIRLAKWAIGQNSYTFKGDIFCIRVYNRALTSTEVTHNYNIDKEAYGI